MTVHARAGTRLAAVTVVAAALLAGCSGSSDDAGSAGVPANAPARQQAGEEDAAGSAGEAEAPGKVAATPGGGDTSADENAASPAGASGPRAAEVVAGAQRRVRTAEVTVEVGNLATAAARVRATATGLGGFVASETTGLATTAVQPTPASTDSQAVPPAREASDGESVIVLRVPEPQLEEALGRIAATGRELSRTSSAEDVTAALADIGSRVATQQRSVQRVRALLDRASSLSDVVMLEGELAKRESELEALQASLRSLSDRADLSTVTAVLRTREVAAKTSTEDDDGFLAGMEQGWDAVVASTTVVLTVLGALLPVAILLTVVLTPLLVLRRRRVRTP